MRAASRPRRVCSIETVTLRYRVAVRSIRAGPCSAGPACAKHGLVQGHRHGRLTLDPRGGHSSLLALIRQHVVGASLAQSMLALGHLHKSRRWCGQSRSKQAARCRPCKRQPQTQQCAVYSGRGAHHRRSRSWRATCEPSWQAMTVTQAHRATWSAAGPGGHRSEAVSSVLNGRKMSRPALLFPATSPGTRQQVQTRRGGCRGAARRHPPPPRPSQTDAKPTTGRRNARAATVQAAMHVTWRMTMLAAEGARSQRRRAPSGCSVWRQPSPLPHPSPQGHGGTLRVLTNLVKGSG